MTVYPEARPAFPIYDDDFVAVGEVFGIVGEREEEAFVRKLRGQRAWSGEKKPALTRSVLARVLRKSLRCVGLRIDGEADDARRPACQAPHRFAAAGG